ncbi:MAG: hypothetical protein RL732_628 [Bacteroidota bacterium]
MTLPVTLQAQVPLLTLEDALGTALQNNYDLLLSKNDSLSFALDRSYAYAAFLPRLNGTTTKLWNINAQKQELANGSKRDTSGLRSNNLNGSIALNWTLFDGLKMFATRKRLMELEQLGSINIKAQMVNTVAAVTTAYYNIVRQKQQLKAIEEQISISEERVKLADRKLTVGLGAKPELLQAKLDLNAQKANKLEQGTLMEQLKKQLNQLMAVVLTSDYDVIDSIPLNTQLQYGALSGSMILSNPTLLQAKKNIDIARLTVKEREAELFPILNFNSAYNFNRLLNQAVINNFTPLFNQNRGFNYGLSFTIPLLNGFNTRRLIQQAKLDVDYQVLNYKNQISRVDLALDNAFRNYEMQKKALQLEQENIDLARENVTIALERFRQGVSTFIELRVAQISLAEAYNRLIAARYNTKLAEIELLKLKGEVVKG